MIAEIRGDFMCVVYKASSEAWYHPVMNRSNLRALVVAALLTLSMPILALPGNPNLSEPGDAVYESVRRLALVAGQSPPSAVAPVSYAELEAVLRRVDVERLPEELVDQYRELLHTLSEEAIQVPFGTVGIETTTEAYLHTSGDAGEWLYWYPDRQPLVSLPLQVMPLPGLAIDFDLDFRKNYPIFRGYESTYETVNPDPWSNIPGDLRETDIQFPFHALLSAAGRGWSVVFGRSRIGWGLGHTGSLLLSDHVDYHDFLMASVTGGLASFRALYLDLEPWLDGGGTDPERLYLARRIELRPARWFTLTASEALVFHGKPIELRYLNPLMVLHSWFIPDYGNSMINLEASVRPVSGLELYAHLAIDQLQSKLEEERAYAADEPEALGYLAGARYVAPLPGAASWLTFGTEWVFLDPWMYIGRSVMGSFTYRRRVQAENVLPAGTKIIVEKSLGYPAGPDYYGITGFAQLEIGECVSLSLDAGYYAAGENAVGRSLPPDDAADAQRETPSGEAPEQIVAGRLTVDGVLARIHLGGVPLVVEAGAVLDLVRIENNDHVAGAVFSDLQFSPYLTISTGFGL